MPFEIQNMNQYMALRLAESFLVQRALNDLYRRFEALKNQVRRNTPSGCPILPTSTMRCNHPLLLNIRLPQLEIAGSSKASQ